MGTRIFRGALDGYLRARGPKSNLQRQREFVARNPHYYRDRRRKERQRYKARLAAQQAEAELSRLLLEAPLFAEVIQQELVAKQQALPAPRKQLALPAPGDVPVIQLELFIPGQPEPIPIQGLE